MTQPDFPYEEPEPLAPRTGGMGGPRPPVSFGAEPEAATPGGETPTPTTAPGAVPLDWSAIIGSLGGPVVRRGRATGTGSRGGRPRRQTLSDAKNAAAIYYMGASYDALGKSEKRTFDRFYEDLDRASVRSFGDTYRFLSPEQRTQVHSTFDQLPDPIPEDDPEYVAAAGRQRTEERRLARLAESEARFQQHRAEAKAQRDADEMARASVKQPDPLRPLQPPKAATLTWPHAALLIPDDDLANLTAAWSSGGDGVSAISPEHWRYLAALLPLSAAVPVLARRLKSLYLSSGGGGSRASRGTSTPTIYRPAGGTARPRGGSPTFRRPQGGARVSSAGAATPASANFPLPPEVLP